MEQDVVSIGIVPDHIPEQYTAPQMQNLYLDNSHMIEADMKDITVHISNDADPALLTRTFRLLQEFSYQVTSPDLRRSTLSVAIRTIQEELLFEKISVIIVNSDILNNSFRIIILLSFQKFRHISFQPCKHERGDISYSVALP